MIIFVSINFEKIYVVDETCSSFIHLNLIVIGGNMRHTLHSPPVVYNNHIEPEKHTLSVSLVRECLLYIGRMIKVLFLRYKMLLTDGPHKVAFVFLERLKKREMVPFEVSCMNALEIRAISLKKHDFSLEELSLVARNLLQASTETSLSNKQSLFEQKAEDAQALLKERYREKEAILESYVKKTVFPRYKRLKRKADLLKKRVATSLSLQPKRSSTSSGYRDILRCIDQCMTSVIHLHRELEEFKEDTLLDMNKEYNELFLLPHTVEDLELPLSYEMADNARTLEEEIEKLQKEAAPLEKKRQTLDAKYQKKLEQEKAYQSYHTRGILRHKCAP